MFKSSTTREHPSNRNTHHGTWILGFLGTNVTHSSKIYSLVLQQLHVLFLSFFTIRKKHTLNRTWSLLLTLIQCHDCCCHSSPQQLCRICARHVTCPTCHGATASIMRFYMVARVSARAKKHRALHPAGVLRATGADLIKLDVGSLSCVLARCHLREWRLLLDDHLRGSRGSAGLGHRVLLQLHPKGRGGILQLSPVLHKATGL